MGILIMEGMRHSMFHFDETLETLASTKCFVEKSLWKGEEDILHT